MTVLPQSYCLLIKYLFKNCQKMSLQMQCVYTVFLVMSDVYRGHSVKTVFLFSHLEDTTLVFESGNQGGHGLCLQY